MKLVTRADGSKQIFDRRKVINTCLKMGLNKREAENISLMVEEECYNGISTGEILKKIFTLAEQYSEGFKHRLDLKFAISLLPPKPEFESFTRLLLQSQGFNTSPGGVFKGKCVEHEIDGVLSREDITYLLEVKHHLNHHAYTGLDVCLVAYSTFNDLNAAFFEGISKIYFQKVLIVCNTKFSAHAKKYAACKGIELIGWKTPENKGLEELIREKKLYPVTVLSSLSRLERKILLKAGFLTLKQLINQDIEELKKKVKINELRLRRIRSEAEKVFTIY